MIPSRSTLTAAFGIISFSFTAECACLWLLYPFTCRWTRRALPCLGCCKQCCCKHWGVSIFSNGSFHPFWICAQEWDCWFSSIVSDSLRPHELQHARPSCPSPTPGVYSNSCPLSRWCHLTISSSVVPFSSCPQPFPTSGSFQIGQLFASGGQNIGSFSFNISPSNEHPGLISFRMDWLDLLAIQGTLNSLLQHHSSKASILWCSVFFIVQLSHPYMTTGKTIALTRRTFVGKVTSLLFNMLSRLVITFLPRSKCLFISRLQSPSAVTLEPQEIKVDT